MKKTLNGISTLFIYDTTGHLVGEYDGTGATIREHVYGPSGRVASMDSGGSIYWHHNDHLGTPQALTNAAGTVEWTMSQTPFGIATVNEDPDGDGNAVTNNFRFPGQYFDAETGLNYNYHRTYDPVLGRYTQADPIGLNGGANRFGYVSGNPVGFVDPRGESIFNIAGGIYGVISGGIGGYISSGGHLNGTIKGAFWGGVAGLINPLEGIVGSLLGNFAASVAGQYTGSCDGEVDYSVAAAAAAGGAAGKAVVNYLVLPNRNLAMHVLGTQSDRLTKLQASIFEGSAGGITESMEAK